ncbi:MAG: VOC family protein [Marinobacter sp.]|uniref:VOC family protein n=1 Tax=Marinobacter sp. TaxID=50741 RepID=UPI00299D53F4|nr:VOC family protein [Marinobacter sp.]MDX1754539.1 VOC family protein [Marinobacter sp.]
MTPTFRPGANLAMKVPPRRFDQTVAFYRDVLRFEALGPLEGEAGESVRFRFGDKILWIDRVDGLSQAELWLEVLTDDVEAASRYLAQQQCIRRDEIEPLPEGVRGFWIASPSDVIHLVTESPSITGAADE